MYPMFVAEIAEDHEIQAMPGVKQRGIDSLCREVESLVEQGLRSFILFGVPEAKDARASDDGACQEVPLGEGQVDWPRYISLLKQAGYDGYFAIEREVGTDRSGDIARGVSFLRSL